MADELDWVRLDCDWYHNPKFLMLVEEKKWRAIAVYWAAVGWSGGHGQAGFVARTALLLLHGTLKEAAELVARNLWEPCEGGWMIHDWDEYQLASQEHVARRKRAQHAAMVRWHGNQT
jgi:hypothetical protein